MKCTVCQTENNYNANYCKSCGSAFSEKQKEDALNKTWIGKLNQFENLISWLKLDKITGHPVFRILVLVCLSLMLLSNVLFKNDTLLLPTEEYKVSYNAKANEYVLLTDLDSISLKLSLKQEPDSIEITALDTDGAMIETNSYAITDSILLTNQKEVSYIIHIIYPNSTETCTVSFK